MQRAGQVGGGILDADDVGVLRQAGHGLDAHVNDATAWDVVDDQLEVDRIGHRHVVPVEALLAWLVVVRGDEHDDVGADAGGVLGQADGLRGAVGAGAGDHRHAFVRGLHRDFDGAAVFLMRERRAFAGGADRDDGFAALFDLPVDEAGVGGLIEAAVGAHRGDQGDDRALEHDCLLRPAPGMGQSGGAKLGTREKLRNRGGAAPYIPRARL